MGENSRMVSRFKRRGEGEIGVRFERERREKERERRGRKGGIPPFFGRSGVLISSRCGAEMPPSHRQLREPLNWRLRYRYLSLERDLD